MTAMILMYVDVMFLFCAHCVCVCTERLGCGWLCTEWHAWRLYPLRLVLVLQYANWWLLCISDVMMFHFEPIWTWGQVVRPAGCALCGGACCKATSKDSAVVYAQWSIASYLCGSW